MSNLSLYQIETELQELLDLRENAIAAGEMPETIEAIDSRIQEYIHREVKKVDGICAMLRAFKDAAERARDEAERIFARAKAFEAQVARLAAATLAAMRAHGVTKLETPENTLRIQGNGGPEPLVVPTPEALPQEYRTITVEFPLVCWGNIPQELREQAAIKSMGTNAQFLRKALKERMKCPECDGVGKVPPPFPTEQPFRCTRCEGKGTVPATVPGAKLLPRREHLIVE